jgi:hypothetical protein
MNREKFEIDVINVTDIDQLNSILEDHIGHAHLCVAMRSNPVTFGLESIICIFDPENSMKISWYAIPISIVSVEAQHKFKFEIGCQMHKLSVIIPRQGI